MNHTKRTEDFHQRVMQLVERIAPHAWATMDALEGAEVHAAIKKILLENTTDSPCIVKAADDEPIFVLRGQDDTADTFVSLWGERTRTHAANLTETNPAYAGLLAKAQDALLCAAEMRQFPNRKRPD